MVHQDPRETRWGFVIPLPVSAIGPLIPPRREALSYAHLTFHATVRLLYGTDRLYFIIFYNMILARKLFLSRRDNGPRARKSQSALVRTYVK